MKIFLRFAKSSFGHGVNWCTEHRLSRGLPRIRNKSYYQILINAGFSLDFILGFKQIADSSSYSVREKMIEIIDINETQPHRILKLPKYILPYIKDMSITLSIIRGLQLLDKKLGQRMER